MQCGSRGGVGNGSSVFYGAMLIWAEVLLYMFGGDLVLAYLSDYKIEEAMEDGAVTTMGISNIGPLQSDETVAIITMNGTGGMLESRCPEGSASTIGARTIVVSFDRMTPGILCEIDVASDVAPPQLTQFTARGMHEAEEVGGWGRTFGNFNLLYAIMLVVQILIVFFAVLVYSILIHDLYWFITTRKYRKSPYAERIAEYVRQRYRLKISHKKASIIEVLAGGEYSDMQLAGTLSLPPSYVKRLLRRMHNSGLLDDDGLEPALRECVEKIKN